MSNYTDPITNLIKSQYDRSTEEVKELLDAKGNLPDKLRTLKRHQLAAGFIGDDLTAVTRCIIVDPAKHWDFIVQHNPRRAERHAGAKRTQPPPSVAPVNGNCFLCSDNIWWQQCGLEIGYDVLLNKRKYRAWANPFPLKTAHFTVATVEHEPQSWVHSPSGKSHLTEMLTDLIDLAQQLPNFLVFYNGDGAGASIPHHRHFQCFERESRELFPLEKVASRDAPIDTDGVIVDDYPITAFHFIGTRSNIDEIVKTLDRWMSAWASVCGENTVSANVIATTGGVATDENRGVFHLYFVARNSQYSRGPGMTGIVGGLEVLGELVFSTAAERERLDAGLVDHAYAKRVLAAVQPPGMADFLRRIRLS